MTGKGDRCVSYCNIIVYKFHLFFNLCEDDGTYASYIVLHVRVYVHHFLCIYIS